MFLSEQQEAKIQKGSLETSFEEPEEHSLKTT